jgi:uncharacterized protein DUF6364
MSKLTLSVDEVVIEQAKRFAEQRGTSVSALVERFLDLLVHPPEVEATPLVASLRGAARGADPEDYHRYLERKYL